MEELNRCPFCNGEAKVTGRKKIKVVCSNCGATSPIFDFKSQAVAYWTNSTAVRCKDCKYYHAEDKWCDKNSHFDEGSARTFDENQFCSLGERK